MKKHAREILALLPRGYSISRLGGKGHPRVIDENGEPVRGPDGMPVHICSSPSDYRSMRNDIARLRRAGVIE
jgi:hypothetical protein